MMVSHKTLRWARGAIACDQYNYYHSVWWRVHNNGHNTIMQIIKGNQNEAVHEPITFS